LPTTSTPRGSIQARGKLRPRPRNRHPQAVRNASLLSRPARSANVGSMPSGRRATVPGHSGSRDRCVARSGDPQRAHACPKQPPAPRGGNVRAPVREGLDRVSELSRTLHVTARGCGAPTSRLLAHPGPGPQPLVAGLHQPEDLQVVGLRVGHVEKWQLALDMLPATATTPLPRPADRRHVRRAPEGNRHGGRRRAR
jgi:hypothetical protein